ncbi:DeoR/GlpR family DNA-binding transcription regulator [Paracoccaceae bacterium Fryx2]|nr:DeoR/GlpR family DNA-binding transcription regulator [Paracoccaceae bacterium Fryx2]
MSSSQREREILDILQAAGSGRILDLARHLGVTEETIRRAIKRLEGEGLVTKVHGGVHLRDWGPEPTFAQRFVQNPAAKRRIAAHLAAMIADGASLFLDVGSTTAYVAQALRQHRELLVVTNSLAVAQALASRNANRVFMAGGELRSHDGGAFGAEALAFVRQFRVQHAVLSAAAVDARAGFLLHDLREAEFSRAIIEQADQAIVAADATKFGRAAPIRVAAPSAFHRLVTDAAPPADIAALLAAAGVQIALVPDDSGR